LIGNRVRLQYCEDETLRAIDWHAHAPEHTWISKGQPTSSRKIFGTPPRANPDLPFTYREKPMVNLTWREAAEACTKGTTGDLALALPTEVEWEKAARGGLVGCRYSWGDEPPDATRCDFDRFDRFSILRPRTFPPNGYGLYGMCGGVWEWTADARSESSGSILGAVKEVLERGVAALTQRDPRGGGQVDGPHVLRGGSWTDCPEAVTVSFRMPRSGSRTAANIGFRPKLTRGGMR
jgi:formylglycine-generating enzyme required for sulfatase activity